MDAAHALFGGRRLGRFQHIYQPPRASLAGRLEAQAQEAAMARPRAFAPAQGLLQHAGGGVAVVHQQGHDRQAPDGLLLADVGGDIARNVFRPILLDQFQRQPIGIEKGERIVGAGRDGHENVFLGQSLYPAMGCALGDGERQGHSLSRARLASLGGGPFEEGQHRARPAGLVAEIEVPGPGIIEIHGALDQPQPQHALIEVAGALRVRTDRGYMVESGRSGHVVSLLRPRHSADSRRRHPFADSPPVNHFRWGLA